MPGRARARARDLRRVVWTDAAEAPLVGVPVSTENVA
jgi:hypothetical protein